MSRLSHKPGGINAINNQNYVSATANRSIPVSFSCTTMFTFFNKLSFCLQVDLKFPKTVSDGAKDLITKLLRHCPTDRLSLQSVIDHSWVRTNSRRVLPPICPGKS